MVVVSAIIPKTISEAIIITVVHAEPGCISAMFNGCIMSAISIATGPK